jgi:hypothetical protein
MSVRAKFKLNRITSSMNYMSKPTGKLDEKGRSIDEGVHVEMRTLVFNPVYGNGDPNHENTKFWQASPSGELQLGTVNPEAWRS